MKCKVRVSGEIERRRTSFVLTIETPDFKEEVREFLGRTWTETILEQQEEWIGDRYEELIVEEAEKRFMYPIGGFKMVVPKLKSKKEEVADLAGKVCEGRSEEFRATLLGTIVTVWPAVKGQSAVKIIETALRSMEMTSKVAVAHLQHLTEILKSTKQIES